MRITSPSFLPSSQTQSRGTGGRNMGRKAALSPSACERRGGSAFAGGAISGTGEGAGGTIETGSKGGSTKVEPDTSGVARAVGAGWGAGVTGRGAWAGAGLATAHDFLDHCV